MTTTTPTKLTEVNEVSFASDDDDNDKNRREQEEQTELLCMQNEEDDDDEVEEDDYDEYEYEYTYEDSDDSEIESCNNAAVLFAPQALSGTKRNANSPSFAWNEEDKPNLKQYATTTNTLAMTDNHNNVNNSNLNDDDSNRCPHCREEVHLPVSDCAMMQRWNAQTRDGSLGVVVLDVKYLVPAMQRRIQECAEQLQVPMDVAFCKLHEQQWQLEGLVRRPEQQQEAAAAATKTTARSTTANRNGTAATAATAVAREPLSQQTRNQERDDDSDNDMTMLGRDVWALAAATTRNNFFDDYVDDGPFGPDPPDATLLTVRDRVERRRSPRLLRAARARRRARAAAVTTTTEKTTTTNQQQQLENEEDQIVLEMMAEMDKWSPEGAPVKRPSSSSSPTQQQDDGHAKRQEHYAPFQANTKVTSPSLKQQEHLLNNGHAKPSATESLHNPVKLPDKTQVPPPHVQLRDNGRTKPTAPLLSRTKTLQATPATLPDKARVTPPPPPQPPERREEQLNHDGLSNLAEQTQLMAMMTDAFEATNALSRMSTQQVENFIHSEIELDAKLPAAPLNSEGGGTQDVEEEQGLDTKLPAVDQAVAPPVDGQQACPICFDDLQDLSQNDTILMSCGHKFCKDCWKGFVEHMFDAAEPDKCLQTTCPIPSCEAVVTNVHIEQVAPELLPKYENRQLHSFVGGHRPTMRWCQGPDCTDRVAVKCRDRLLQNTLVASCGACQTKFCFRCGREPHGDRYCELDTPELSEGGRPVKDCPRCSVKIEKIGGCNRMRCKCGHYFCWICLGDMPDYNHFCGREGEDADDGMMNMMARAMNARRGEAGRAAVPAVTVNIEYILDSLKGTPMAYDDEIRVIFQKKWELDHVAHYFNRYNAHEQGQRFAENQCERLLEGRAIDFAKSSDLKSANDTDFLAAANKRLVASRRMLKYTYCYAFFLPDEEREGMVSQKGLFQNHQERLERFTETLSEISEHALTYEDRAKIVNLMGIIDQCMEAIVGFEEFGAKYSYATRK